MNCFFNLGWVWIAVDHTSVFFLAKSYALFTKLISTKKCKVNFKIRFYGTIYIFKNYFVILFSVFSKKWYPNRPLFDSRL